jgi:hypothetical protein
MDVRREDEMDEEEYAEAAAATQLSVLKQQLAAAQATNATFTT